MSARQPWITGTAFALTAAFVNVACAIAVLLYPDAVLQLANSWAHGIDLTAIRRAPDDPLTLSAWAYGLATSSAFAFVAGAIYRWSLNALSRIGAARGSSLHLPSRS